MRAARLIDQHGAEMGLPELRTIIAADCPRMGVVDLYDQCGVHFPKAGAWR